MVEPNQFPLRRPKNTRAWFKTMPTAQMSRRYRLVALVIAMEVSIIGCAVRGRCATGPFTESCKHICDFITV